MIAPDGCAVELYALLPPMGEPEIVHHAIPAGASVLELGAGAGRVTHRLVELGHPVVAVDESPDMLARIRGATGIPDAPGPEGAASTSAGLAEAGLAVDAYLTGDSSWVRAVPASGGDALGRSPR